MRLVIIHYHLNRGGVTRVIANHLLSLAAIDSADQPEQVTILYGGRADDWDPNLVQTLPFPVKTQAIPALDYDRFREVLDRQSTAAGVAAVLDPVRTALSEAGCHPDNTVLHIHNHSLGKNVHWPEAWGTLGREGWRLLLQIHDFAEDLRPANYRHMLDHVGSLTQLQGQLYPQASHVHYATLTRNDWSVLAESGVELSQLHLLPNPVPSSFEPVDRSGAREKLRMTCGVPSDRPFVIYPVRAIRRKNIGEVLLWAALLDQVTFAITLAPLNPDEVASYQRWVELAAELELPVLFDVGGRGGMTLRENYAAADAALTTSVAEGFGMVYLEASLADRPLFGRNLPGVTADFIEAGLEYPGLVDAIWIPSSCFDVPRRLRQHDRLASELRAAFGMQESDSAVPLDPITADTSDATTQRGHSQTHHHESIDFSRLDAQTQINVIRQLAEHPQLRDQVRRMNDCFDRLLRALTASQLGDRAPQLAKNRAAISKNYSFQVIGAKYARICRDVMKSPISTMTSDARLGESILHHFLHPDRLLPIR